MKKKLLFSMLVFGLTVSFVHAGLTFLPASDMTEYTGYSYFNQNGVSGRLEFAVYDTTSQDLEELEGISGYNGEHYVYAYQIFSSSIDAITSFSLFGYNPDAFTEEDMATSQTLGGADSYGNDADSLGLFADEAAWFFDGGVMVAYEASYFLMIFSDYAPIVGDYEVNSSGSNPNVPGDEHAPEPATLLLLAGGAVLSLRRRK